MDGRLNDHLNLVSPIIDPGIETHSGVSLQQIEQNGSNLQCKNVRK